MVRGWGGVYPRVGMTFLNCLSRIITDKCLSARFEKQA